MNTGDPIGNRFRHSHCSKYYIGHLDRLCHVASEAKLFQPKWSVSGGVYEATIINCCGSPFYLFMDEGKASVLDRIFAATSKHTQQVPGRDD